MKIAGFAMGAAFRASAPCFQHEWQINGGLRQGSAPGA
jgi:hypothetical protein